MIVDASVAVKWMVEEEQSDIARELLGRIDLAAPTLIHVEVANAIWKKRARGEIDDEKQLVLLPEMLASILQTIDEVPVMPRALALAFELKHPAYDCVYLALAELLDQQLVTADVRFLKRVRGHPSAARIMSLGQ